MDKDVKAGLGDLGFALLLLGVIYGFITNSAEKGFFLFLTLLGIVVLLHLYQWTVSIICAGRNVSEETKA
jgi:hypothetical protein